MPAGLIYAISFSFDFLAYVLLSIQMLRFCFSSSLVSFPFRSTLPLFAELSSVTSAAPSVPLQTPPNTTTTTTTDNHHSQNHSQRGAPLVSPGSADAPVNGAGGVGGGSLCSSAASEEVDLSLTVPVLTHTPQAAADRPPTDSPVKKKVRVVADRPNPPQLETSLSGKDESTTNPALLLPTDMGGFGSNTPAQFGGVGPVGSDLLAPPMLRERRLTVSGAGCDPVVGGAAETTLLIPGQSRMQRSPSTFGEIGASTAQCM